MCEANETLQKARYALDLMVGTGVYDIGKLKQILGQQCQEGNHERN
jgi:hypothetical protein